jgi:uncharacterized protein (DUF1778 family)
MNKTLSTKHYITINNKKYTYELSPASKETSHVICEAANINQEFLNEDVPELLNDLANLILAEKDYSKTQSAVIRFRVSVNDKKLIEKNAAKKGYASVSSYLKDISLGQV